MPSVQAGYSAGGEFYGKLRALGGDGSFFRHGFMLQGRMCGGGALPHKR
jgi:hypothetical protein